MKHSSGHDNISETEACYPRGNMKAPSGHLDWGPGTKGPHNDPADKTFLGLCIVSNVCKWSSVLLKMG